MTDEHDKIRITWDEVNSATGNDTQTSETPDQQVHVADANCRGRFTPARIAVLLVVAVVVIGVLLLWAVDRSRRNNPTVTVGVVESIQTENDLQKYKDHFTAKGFGLMQWLIVENSKQEGEPLTLSYGPPQINGDLCQVWGTSENSRLAIQLVKQDRWMFDDIYVATIEGRDVNLLATYIRDNPMLTVLKIGWPDLLYGFLQGFMIGAGY